MSRFSNRSCQIRANSYGKTRIAKHAATAVSIHTEFDHNEHCITSAVGGGKSTREASICCSLGFFARHILNLAAPGHTPKRKEKVTPQRVYGVRTVMLVQLWGLHGELWKVPPRLRIDMDQDSPEPVAAAVWHPSQSSSLRPHEGPAPSRQMKASFGAGNMVKTDSGNIFETVKPIECDGGVHRMCTLVSY